MRKAAMLAGFTLVMLAVKSVSAQTNITNDYVVISNAGVSNLSEYTAALDAANWETYRIQDQRYSLSFDNGLTIELKSAVEMIDLGYSLNIASYRTQNPDGYIPPVLKLLPGNIIGMEIQSTPHTKFK